MPRSMAAAVRRTCLPRAAWSAATCRDENPVWIGGSRVARKGPVIGLLGRVLGVAVDDASVHRARNIDLLRRQFYRHLGVAPQQLGFDDVRVVQPLNSRFQRLL